MIMQVTVLLFDDPSEEEVEAAKMIESIEGVEPVVLEPFVELDVVVEGPDPTFPAGVIRGGVMRGVSQLLDQAHEEIKKLGRSGRESGIIKPRGIA